MARISNTSAYPNLVNPVPSDYLILTDQSDQLLTKSCTLGDVQSLFGLDTLVAHVAVNSASLLSSYSDPVTLIANPGAEKVFDVMDVMISFEAGSQVYNFANDVSLFAGSSPLYTINKATLNNAASSVAKLHLNASVGSQIAVPKGVPLTLQAAGSNPSQGNGLLYLNIFYRVLTVGSAF